MIDVGRSHEEEVLNEGARGVDGFGKFDVFGGVGFREWRDGFGGFADVGVEEERAAVGGNGAQPTGLLRVRLDPLEAVTIELHVAQDFRNERPGSGRNCGGAEAGMEFERRCGAADGGTAFEDERLVSSAGEIKRGDEGILASADDEDVARSHLVS